MTDPGPTLGALRALQLPGSLLAVRVGAGLEAGLGAAGLVATSSVVAYLVAASYVGFAGFTIVALASRTPLSTCGCLGRLDTPPSVPHVLVDLVAAVAAVMVGANGYVALLDESGRHGLVVLGATVLAAAAGFLVLTGRVSRVHR